MKHLLDKVRDKNYNLTKEDLDGIKVRTAQLFEIMAMCEDEASSKVCMQEIVELNIRLVPRVLSKYKPFGEDEMQIGCVGLIKSVNSFKIERGVPFVNYACFCIEREMHAAHKLKANTFEFQAGNFLSSIDDELAMSNGDSSSKHELIADEASEAEFRALIESENLDNLFDVVINPAIEEVAGNTKGNAKVDFELWRALELRYILDIAEVDSQKARFTLNNLAESLGVSRQNVRMRHQRVLDAIRVRCEELGYLTKEAQ